MLDLECGRETGLQDRRVGEHNAPIDQDVFDPAIEFLLACDCVTCFWPPPNGVPSLGRLQSRAIFQLEGGGHFVPSNGRHWIGRRRRQQELRARTRGLRRDLCRLSADEEIDPPLERGPSFRLKIVNVVGAGDRADFRQLCMRQQPIGDETIDAIAHQPRRYRAPKIVEDEGDDD